MAKNEEGGTKVLALNRKAWHNYSFDETFECGISLVGTEVKSMKDNQFSFADAYARVDKDELWLIAFHINPYMFGNRNNHDPDQKRRLLVHKKEIRRLRRITEEKGLTLVPLKFYLKRGFVKLELGVGRGKKLFDKREDIKKKDLRREVQREHRIK